MSEHDVNNLDRIKKALVTIKKLQGRIAELESQSAEAIAIIGMSCCFPQAADPDAYWALLCRGTDAIREVPSERWDIEAYYDPDPDAPGKMYTRYGGFIDQVDQFDAAFFGISPLEAEYLDPQHRLVLIESWRALENAGLAPDRLVGSSTGVYVGISCADYSHRVTAAGIGGMNAYYGIGNALNAAAGRVAHVLGLQGPAMAIDTACSSSLVALHQAGQGLRHGDCDLALAGGVNLILAPMTTIAACRAHMLAADGRCKTFDNAADGYVRGEGCGIVVLKLLADARRDGDTVLAVMRGSAVSQNGVSSSLTVPNGEAQRALLRRALAAARLQPGDVSYVEAHGTGTALGDPIEVQALAAVFAAGHTQENPLLIGSVKTNIGHLESAAGIAGVIKVVQALRHGHLPPHLHLSVPNAHIPWQDLAVKVTTEAAPWPARVSRRIAGVSSFGFSGTNAHLLIEAAPPMALQPARAERPVHVLALSARTQPALEAVCERLQQWLTQHPEADLADVCYTANTGRAHLEKRLAVVADTMPEARRLLTAAQVAQGEITTPPKIAFLFSGQGSQYAGMARGLYETWPVFRASLEQSAAQLTGRLDRPLTEILFNPETPLAKTVYTQPALFALQLALVDLWESWGVRPFAVLGHSVGELAAACTAGILSRAHGLQLIVERGRLMQSLPEGAMAAILADRDTVARAVAEVSEVSIAAVNGANTVIAGPQPGVERVRQRLAEQGIRAILLETSHAFHSMMMEPILPQLEAFAASLQYHPPQLAMIANLTGTTLSARETLDAGYWRRHAREPVEFARGLRTCAALGCNLLVEIGPHPVLVNMAREVWPAEHPRPVCIPSLRRHREAALQISQAVAELWVQGAAVDFRQYDAAWARQKLALPTYPFQTRRFWMESRAHVSMGNGAHHALLGNRHQSAVSGEEVYTTSFSRTQPSFLEDHRVYGPVLVPGATYAAMALAATGVPACLEQVAFREPLLLPEDGNRDVQLVFGPLQDAHARAFSLLSKHPAQDAQSWVLHAEGRVTQAGTVPTNRLVHETLENLRARLQPREPEALFAAYAKLGVQLGPTFRSIHRLWGGNGEALAELLIPEIVTEHPGHDPIHPAVFDACTQVTHETLSDLRWRGDELGFFAPLEYGRVILTTPVPRAFFVYARLRSEEPVSTATETMTFDLQLMAAHGDYLGEIRGFVVKRAPREAMLRALKPAASDLRYTLHWQGEPRRLPFVTGAQPLWPRRRAQDVSHLSGPADELARLERYRQLIDQVEQLCLAYVRQALEGLGWAPQAGDLIQTRTLMEQLRLAARHQGLVGRLLEILAETGVIDAHGRFRSLTVEMQSPPSAVHDALLRTYPEGRIELTLISRCGERLDEVLRGSIDPLELLFPRDGTIGAEQLYREAAGPALLNAAAARALAAYVDTLPVGRTLRVLEIGAGTGGTTSHLLPVLPAERTRYTFTDISSAFFLNAESRFAEYPYVSYGVLDIDREPVSQGFTPHDYDLVIAANVLHATPDLDRTMHHVSRLLAPGGLLLLMEGTRRRRWLDLTFGLLEGWWLFNDAVRQDYPLLSVSAWLQLLRAHNFADPIALTPGANALDQAIILAHAAASPETTEMTAAETWLICADTAGQGARLAEALAHTHRQSILVERGEVYRMLETRRYSLEADRPEDWTRLLGDIIQRYGNVHGVIYLWGLDCSEQHPHAADLTHELRFSCAGLLSLVQALARHRQHPGYGLWIVTQGAAPTGGETLLCPPQATLWGMGRVIAQEHPELGCRLLDLEPGAEGDLAASLLPEFLLPGREDQIALRGSQRRLPRLQRQQPQDAVTPFVPRPKATYLITGGLRGLGPEVARRLATLGAHSLVLMGRQAPDAQALHLLDELQAQGCQAVAVQGDVSQEDDVRRVFDHIAANLPALAGIFHGAGVLADAAIVNQSWSHFATVFAPKVLGTHHLVQYTRSLDLQCFVLFSTSVALLGAAGQSNHAAANAYLDVLAHHLRAHHVPAISINWGGWSQIGAAARRDIATQLAAVGISMLSPAQGLAELEAVLAEQPVQRVVLPVHWGIFARQFRTRPAPALLTTLLADVPREVGRQDVDPKALKRRLQEAPPEQAQAVILDFITEQVSRILRLDSVDDLNPNQALFDLGMDSLMLVELRNRLQTQLGTTFSLPSTVVFDFPNLTELATYLTREAFGIAPREQPASGSTRIRTDAAARTAAAIAQTAGELKQLSLEELASLLDADLANLRTGEEI